MAKARKVEVYMNARHEFAWRLKAANGLIQGDSGEGYSTRTGLVKALRGLRDDSRAQLPALAPIDTVMSLAFNKAMEDAMRLNTFPKG